MLPFVIVGLTSGSVYALGGVGLVLTYKTSGIFNFGYGALATLGAYSFYALHVQAGLNWPLSVFLSVVVLGVGLGLLFEPFARRLSAASLGVQVAGTVGITLVVQGAFLVLYGTQTRLFPPFLPQNTFKIDGTDVTVASAITVALVLVTTAVFYAFFRRARHGVAMRAVVDNADLLDLSGTPPRTVRRLAWMIGCMFAALSGVLIGPTLTLDATVLTLLIVQTFGAAAIGRFASLPGTYVGGLLIGVVASVVSKYVTTSASPLLGGIPSSVPFLTLFAAMMLMPARWLVAHQRVVPVAARWRAPAPTQIAGLVVLFVFLAFVPAFAGFRLTAWTAAVADAILFLSLGLLVRTSGQVSLGQVAFAAIGAAAFGHFAADGLPWLVAVVLCGLVAVPIGALLAIPAIRLGGLYLALATFGFGLLLSNMFYFSGLMFGSAGLATKPPDLSWLPLSSAHAFYYVVLAFFLVAAVSVLVITRSRLGRLLTSMADSQTALVTGGTNVAVTRIIVFAISAAMAAVAGALWSMTNTFASGDDFPTTNSLIYIALITITVGGVPWYAIIAGIGFVVVPTYFNSPNIVNYLTIVFGVSAIHVALVGVPVLPLRVKEFVERVSPRWRWGRRGGGSPVVAAASEKVQPGALRVDGLEVRFGGLVAVSDFSLSAPTGKITGLIGPNGAGKTTTFNAICGLNRPSQGKISLDDRDITRAPSDRRARYGIGRTFQQMELFDSLTVAENVALGREASLAGGNPVRHVVSRRGDRVRIDAAVSEALVLCGVDEIADVTVGSLSTGQRRLVELARCLAGPFRILLLDEPSSGLDRVESRQFGEILKRVVAQRGVGILLVEHDMSVVMEVCEHIFVLDFGRPIFDGIPSEVRDSVLVQEAYLGSAELEVDLEEHDAVEKAT
jgi:ABC-type branched-subunit amino acid transport system ATPase component/branched-subunit amino acid ABC-type transport system permease component